MRRALVTSRVPPSHRWSLACLIAEVIGLPQDGRSGPPREAESAPARREWKEVLGEVGERRLREEEQRLKPVGEDDVSLEEETGERCRRRENARGGASPAEESEDISPVEDMLLHAASVEQVDFDALEGWCSERGGRRRSLSRPQRLSRVCATSLFCSSSTSSSARLAR